MMILLPYAKDGLKDFKNNFSPIDLREISKKIIKHDVMIKFPSFKMSCEIY